MVGMAFSFATPAPQQQQQSLFGNISQARNFSQPLGFQFSPAQQQQQQQLQFQQVAMQQPQSAAPMLLFTADKQPAGYGTKFEELHPDSQKFLLQIEERVQQYRDESQRLYQCARLVDSPMATNTFELDANRILQELQRLSIAKDRQNGPVQRLITTVKEIMRHTESAIRSYTMLRSRFLNRTITSTSNIGSTAQILGASNGVNQPASASSAPVYDFYSGLPKRPSPFLEQTCARFEKYLGECCQKIEELEELLLIEDDRPASKRSALQTISRIMSNNFDFLMHLAGEVEELHGNLDTMKPAFLADRWRRGLYNNPFLEADRREAALQEANARRLHPTLHQPAIPAQPSTQVAGLFASSSTPPPASVAPQLPGGSSAASSAGAFSMFGTPSTPAAASTSSPFLLSTPAAASAPASLFASTPAFTPQPSPFASASTPPLLGSSPSPSPFGATAPSFASAPAAASSLFFSNPLTSGPVVGSGSSFGTAARTTRSKSRPTRR